MIEHPDKKFPPSTGAGQKEDDSKSKENKPTESAKCTTAQQSAGGSVNNTPAVVEESPVEPIEDENKFEANFDQHFEANFDDAFGESPTEAEIPKQVVGGRASIPEELAPHQLARLQNLKESNA